MKHTLLCSCYCRYNIYKRVTSLMEKIKNKKKVKLDSTFLPKRKRVLNKSPLRVLNIPVTTTPVKKQRSQVDNVLLDSQFSISSFWDSQGRGPSPPTSPSVPVSDHDAYYKHVISSLCVLFIRFRSRRWLWPRFHNRLWTKRHVARPQVRLIACTLACHAWHT